MFLKQRSHYAGQKCAHQTEKETNANILLCCYEFFKKLLFDCVDLKLKNLVLIFEFTECQVWASGRISLSSLAPVLQTQPRGYIGIAGILIVTFSK